MTNGGKKSQASILINVLITADVQSIWATKIDVRISQSREWSRNVTRY